MNVGRKPLFVLDQDCLVIADRITQEVEKAGMRAMRSFDLDVVRSSRSGFCCPVHGTSACTCHLVILLIMMQGHACMTMILEGIDEQTSVYLDSGQDMAEEQVSPSLTAALLSAFFPQKSFSK